MGARKTNVMEPQDIETRFTEIRFEASRHSILYSPGRERVPVGRTIASITASGNLYGVPDGFERSASLSTGVVFFVDKAS